MSIVAKRKHPTLGPIFGVYYQPDIIPTQSEFEQLLPGFKKRNFDYSLSTLIQDSDYFLVRKQERWYKV